MALTSFHDRGSNLLPPNERAGTLPTQPIWLAHVPSYASYDSCMYSTLTTWVTVRCINRQMRECWHDFCILLSICPPICLLYYLSTSFFYFANVSAEAEFKLTARKFTAVTIWTVSEWMEEQSRRRFGPGYYYLLYYIIRSVCGKTGLATQTCSSYILLKNSTMEKKTKLQILIGAAGHIPLYLLCFCLSPCSEQNVCVSFKSLYV